ncbi:hypothetical protein G7Y89_g4949 [Cudoniella acicularis]|uniref:O-methyltransferase C-terminal domain-containing protein n=1 Tax=Cudoniella acicularis TaxID=354080 RepID=A0A8H4RNE3_9HELO|nr:hypothetical protein G7Y89_g4949 [Cudoniella acicularis]
MEELTSSITSIRSLANSPSTTATERVKILDSLRKLMYEIEQAEDFHHRPKQLPMLQIGVKVGIFRMLCERENTRDEADVNIGVSMNNDGQEVECGKRGVGIKGAMTVVEVAERKGASVDVVGRLLRYLAAMNVVKEVGSNTFAANESTRSLATDAWEASVMYTIENLLPICLALPSFLAKTAYQDPTEPTKTAFNQAFNTDKPYFEWLATDAPPGTLERFSLIMGIPRDLAGDGNEGGCFGVWEKGWVEVGGEFDEGEEDEVVFVDVGGGRGHQCLAFREYFKSVKGRVILQDLPDTVAGLDLSAQGVEVMGYDFFTPQPFIGARNYYLRNVLHDHPDSTCAHILQNLLSALKGAKIRRGESRILIDECVLPDTGVDWRTTSQDLGMMAIVGSKERNRLQWEGIIKSVEGLEVKDVRLYDEVLGGCVIVAGLMDRNEIEAKRAAPEQGEEGKWTIEYKKANQRLPDSISEDKINKPWRPIPMKRISAQGAQKLLLWVIPIVLIATYFLGGFEETIAMMVLTWMYNDLSGADHHYLTRNLINALCFICYSSGSTKVAAGYELWKLNDRMRQWLVIVACIVFSALQMQDMADMRVINFAAGELFLW